MLVDELALHGTMSKRHVKTSSGNTVVMMELKQFSLFSDLGNPDDYDLRR